MDQKTVWRGRAQFNAKAPVGGGMIWPAHKCLAAFDIAADGGCQGLQVYRIHLIDPLRLSMLRAAAANGSPSGHCLNHQNGMSSFMSRLATTSSTSVSTPLRSHETSMKFGVSIRPNV